MKLDGFARIAVVATALTAGCGAGRPTAPAVGTTELTAADLTTGRSEDAPKVSKSHRAEPLDEGSALDEPGLKPAPRRNDRRPGSGFSGYK